MLSPNKQKIIHRLFLGAVIIVGMLSLIPPIQRVGALVLRGLVFLNLATITATEKS
jgi:hypothetical protein